MFNRLHKSWGAGWMQVIAVIGLALLNLFPLSGSTNGQDSGLKTAENAMAAAGSQVAQNQVVEVEGRLEIMYQDFKDGQHKLLYSLKKSDGTRVQLKFVDRAPTNHLSGDHVRVSGQMSGGNLVLYSGSTTGGGGGGTTTSGDATGGTTSTSIPVPYTFGTQSTLVILVNFQDEPTQPYTITDAQNAFFSTANSFFEENSYGQTSITGDVVGWYTIPVSVTTCDTSQIAADAQSVVTAAGVNLANYTRYVYAFPQNYACGFAGASYVGGNPSQSWINGNSLQVATVTHELGHAFGLWHSHSLNCGTTATICSSGTTVEYGDIVDVMGGSQPPAPHYNAFQKERLGWLNYGASPAIQTVNTNGTYAIYPYEVGGPGPNALKIFKGNDPTTGAKSWYYIEARQGIGFDAFLTNGTCGNCWNQTVTDGVLVHTGIDGNGNSGDLLDMTPATPTYYWYFDPSLVAGQSFQDPTAGVTVTTTSVSGTGAAVQITLNGSPCTAANPTVSIAPSQSQNVTSGTAVSFAAAVTDNDSSSCAAATFNLADVLPSGWTGVWSNATLSLFPGKSGSATLTVTSPAGTADGSYGVNVSATNAASNSDSGSATATYVINTAPLSVSLTTNQSSYLPGQTVGIGVSMLYGTLPDAGASVSVTVTSPRGRATTVSGTTGSNGVAVLNYKLARNAPAGTYQVQYGAGGSGTVAAAAASLATSGVCTSFVVQ